MGTRACEWTQGMSVGTTVDMKAKQWAQDVLVGKDMSVGTRTCQWAEGCDNVYKGLSAGTKVFQVAQDFLLNTSM